MSTPTQPERKILSHKDLLASRATARAAGRRVVHCHGCFDIVHPGHIRHLKFAKSLGDLLLVSITGDHEMTKGDGRPLIPQELRAENLAELDCVDWVFVEPRPTAADLLAEVQPDVYIKGREYETNADPRFRAEREAVERSGGRVVFSSGDVVFSSTALIAAMESSVDPFHHRLTQLLARTDMQPDRLLETLTGLRGKRLVVLGEVIRDTYLFCDRPDIAHESPVMTLRPVDRRSFDGGAAVIARHAAALGARPVLVTALPETAEAEAFRAAMASDGIEVLSVASPARIPEKQRYLVQSQKVLKVDLVEPLVLDTAGADALLEAARQAVGSGADAAILADFGLGLFSPALVTRLCTTLRPHTGVLAGDVSGRRHSLRAMRHLDLVCPSEDEVRTAYSLHGEALPSVAWRLLHETRSKAAVVTMGAEGLVAFEPFPDAAEPAKAGDPLRSRVRGEHVPALSPHAIDPLGCGDALITTATLALAAGAGLVPAVFLGSVAAAVHAQRLGNPTLEPSELRRTMLRLAGARLAYAGTEVKPLPAGSRQAS
ncbi:MAG: adenylyltransferase/cytidyltransferase family protein [Phycisphaerales bacterium]|nr:adenylyltransferase/cytidyltransferase family protein [Phycisphaerales bacterium]